MYRRSLTELASNPDLISGIYNYCDRWCERCSFTSRCLVYATEQEDNNQQENRDLVNSQFWERLGEVLAEAREMIVEWARQTGVDLNTISEDDYALFENRRRRKVDNHFLVRAGKKYANDVADWFREFDQTIVIREPEVTPGDLEDAERLEDIREVISWYQYQIAVKTMRALSARRDEREWLPATKDRFVQLDSDGSAKVALIGVDRSIAAWRLMQLLLPERAEEFIPLILQLEALRYRLEREFPAARSFIRPGFDEVVGEPN